MKQYTSDKWKQRYLDMARNVSEWSKDPSSKVGAIVVGKNGQIVSQGYNGFPRGISDTEERYNDRETKYKYVIHAETNAIYNAIHNGASVKDCTIYVWGLPVCHECAKVIIQCGIKHVVMYNNGSKHWQTSNGLSLKMFDEVGVTYEFFKII